MKSDIAASVKSFVRALDECNFEEARLFLAPGCRYLMNQTELTGPKAILQSYADNAKWARETLERVVYESEIEQKSARVFNVLYTDRIFHHGLEHAYQCRQSLFVNEGGGIEQIVHGDMAGEPEALKEFLERCGIKRP